MLDLGVQFLACLPDACQATLICTLAMHNMHNMHDSCLAAPKIERAGAGNGDKIEGCAACKFFTHWTPGPCNKLPQGGCLASGQLSP